MKTKAFWFSLLVVALIFFIFGFGLKADKPIDGLKLWFLNVGQGDSILIDNKGYQILVDGGPDETVTKRLGTAMGLDKNIELVIVTHNDSDHLKGVVDVLQHYQVNKVWISGATHTTQTYAAFVRLIKEKNIPVETVKAGNIFNENGLSGIVIYPFDVLVGQSAAKQNNDAIVTYWQYGSESFLLTDDIEEANELEMLGRGVVKPADILKVAHHGSNSSSTVDFLKVVKPKVAVISVGKNSYGHPHQVILDRLKQIGAEILRTDQQGTIRFIISKTSYSYQTNL